MFDIKHVGFHPEHYWQWKAANKHAHGMFIHTHRFNSFNIVSLTSGSIRKLTRPVSTRTDGRRHTSTPRKCLFLVNTAHVCLASQHVPAICQMRSLEYSGQFCLAMRKNIYVILFFNQSRGPATLSWFIFLDRIILYVSHESTSGFRCQPYADIAHA